MKIPFRIWAAASASIFSVTAGAAGPAYQATLLEAHEAYTSVYPRALSETGVLLALATADDDPTDPDGTPIWYPDRTLAELRVPAAATQSFAAGLNNAGLVVGQSLTAWYWRDQESNPLPGRGGPGVALGVNSQEEIVGSEINDLLELESPVYWQDPVTPPIHLEGLYQPPESEPVQGTAIAINELGVILGSVLEAPGSSQIAVVWARADAAPQPIPSIHNPTAINVRGDVSGWRGDRAILYFADTDTPVELDMPGGGAGAALGLNDAADVVGEWNDAGVARGFLYRDGRFHDLNDLVRSANVDTGYIASAVDINNAGQIAARWKLPDGSTRAAILDPIDVFSDGFDQ